MRDTLRLVLTALLLSLTAQILAAPEPAKVPKAISAPMPDYPLEAFRLRLRGTAIVILDIDPKTGNVGRARLRQSSGHRRLDRNALRTLSKWQFEPGGEARVAIPIEFSPNGVRLGKASDPDQTYAFEGKLVEVSAKKIAVRGRLGTDEITLDAKTKITRNGQPATLKDAKIGDEISGTARVTSETGALAVSIDLK